MTLKHTFLAILVALVWGCNFIFVKFALNDFSPLLLCAVRFFLAGFPAILFIPKPDAPFKTVAFYGLIMFGLQFALFFTGMYMGVTPALASLLIQVQVFFGIFFAAVILKEIPNSWQIVGALISFLGICLIGTHIDKTLTLAGFVLIMGAAATWGAGNIVVKKINQVNVMSLVVWGSFISFPPMLLLSYFMEGGLLNLTSSLTSLTWLGIISVIYIVYISTWVGYGVWNWLVSRYPLATIAPFTLLIPLFGMFSAWLIGETLESWKLIAGIFIVAGLAINIISARFFIKK